MPEVWDDVMDDVTTIEELEVRIEDLEAELKVAEHAAKHPSWGDCKRGCLPSYLDREGFCSPACHVGAPRGQYVTLRRTKLA